MSHVSWTVDTNGSNVTVDSIRGGMPTHTRGETIPIDLGFVEGNTSPYTTLREYLDYAPAAATFTGVDGTPYYQAVRPGHDPLFGFDPTGAGHSSETEGIWGVLTGGQDMTGAATSSQLKLRFRIFVLAEYADFSTRTDVENAHEKTPSGK